MTRGLVVLLAIAGVASAEPTKEDVQKAAELFDKGRRHFDIAEYANAISAWKTAYLLSNEPLLLFNIAQAYRLAGDCAQANRFYLNYKRVQPKPANQSELDSAMGKCAGVEPATTDTTTPPIKPIEPIKPIASKPEPLRKPIDTGETDPGRKFRISGILIVGVGGAAGIVALVSAFQANRKADEISGTQPGTEWDATLMQTDRDGKSAQTRSRIFGVIGAVAAVGGGVLWVYGRGTSRVRVGAAVTPAHSEVRLSCAF